MVETTSDVYLQPQRQPKQPNGCFGRPLDKLSAKGLLVEEYVGISELLVESVLILLYALDNSLQITVARKDDEGSVGFPPRLVLGPAQVVIVFFGNIMGVYWILLEFLLQSREGCGLPIGLVRVAKD